jgi:hypothetical protein
MADAPVTSSQQLMAGILKGEVSRQVRLFAAQGLLPVSREDLFRLQVILSADPDEELAKVATASVSEVAEETVIDWVHHGKLEGMALDLLIRVRDEERIWAIVAQNAATSDETLRVMARHGPRLVQDILITNQVRVLSCLEILEDLRGNAQIDQVVMRRVREFEEEFIEKAIHEEDDAEGTGLSIEDAIHSLRSIGGHIPKEGPMPYPEDDDPSLRDAVTRVGESAFGRLLVLDIKGKIMAALKGSREERAILINSRNRLVVRAVLSSPKLSDPEVERIATSRSVSDEVIRTIAANPRWMQLYGVIVALAQNPKTPPQVALRIVSRLAVRDIARLSRDRNINPVVRRRAKEMFERRR